jgi:hypothetical protein
MLLFTATLWLIVTGRRRPALVSATGVFALVVVLGLTACGGGGNTFVPPTPTPTPTPQSKVVIVTVQASSSSVTTQIGFITVTIP